MLPIHFVGWVLVRHDQPRWGSIQQGPGQFVKIPTKQHVDFSLAKWAKTIGWFTTHNRANNGWIFTHDIIARTNVRLGAIRQRVREFSVGYPRSEEHTSELQS